MNHDLLDPKLGHAYGVRHFNSTTDGLLSGAVATELGLGAVNVESLIWLGAIYCNHVRVHTDISVKAGDYLRVHTQPRRYALDKIKFPELVVFKNTEFIVINKPSGLPVHATVDNFRENLVTELSLKLGVELKMTHRLDNATSGLMVFALTESFQKKFNSLLRAGKVKKTYRARVHGTGVMAKFASPQWVHYMEPGPRAPKKVTRTEHAEWQKCILNILSEREISTGISELFIDLETGRTHQIRAQLGIEGHPVVGDGMYGSPTPNADELIELQSQQLSFVDHSFMLQL